MDLSIVIPVWNEESKIAADILNINNHFSKSDLKVELIIVDDGSTDQTRDIIKSTFKKISLQSKVIHCEHKGKGHAVSQGVLASRGQITMFMDSGGNVPLRFINSGIEKIKSTPADMVFGSRYHKESTIWYDKTLHRKFSSILFRKTIRILFNLSGEISDSQCGFKLFRGDLAREIFKKVTIDGFLFDLEVILLTRNRGLKIIELPLEWHCDRDSRLNIFTAFGPLLKELFFLKKI